MSPSSLLLPNYSLPLGAASGLQFNDGRFDEACLCTAAASAPSMLPLSVTCTSLPNQPEGCQSSVVAAVCD